MEEFVVKIIMVGVVSWTLLFVFIRYFVLPKCSYEFSNRVVSTCHAILGVTLASLSVEDWRCPACPLDSESTDYQMKTLAVSLSYFIYDLVCCCIFDPRQSLDNSIHHLVCIVGLVAGLSYQRCGSEMVAALWITEVSSPFLHLRELLKEVGIRDTDLNIGADVAFGIIFSVARMVGGPYLTFVTVSANNPFIIKAMALGLQLVSVFWFYKIARMIRYKLTKRNAVANKVN